MRSGGISEFPIRNFGGLNLKDAGDRVRDNEFTELSNLYQPAKGILGKRYGSIIDEQNIPLCSRVSGVYRHYAPNRERFTLYHCVPDSTLLPDNTTDLVLTDVTSTDGNIFGGGANAPLYVCYSWIGAGLEQTYNTKNRAGFGALSFPLNSWNNTSHQTITLGAATNKLQVTVPAFPTGVRGANIFVARGGANPVQMTYMGTVTTSGGSLIVSEFIGPYNAFDDPITLPIPKPCGLVYAGGTLKPGTYYVATAWVVDPNCQEGSGDLGQWPTLQGVGTSVLSWGSVGSTSSSAVTGNLVPNTTYDVIFTVLDANTSQETYVSSLLSVNTGASQYSFNVTTPTLPSGATAGSRVNIYANVHGKTPVLVVQAALTSVTINIASIPTGTSLQTPPALSRVSNFVPVSVSGAQNAIQVTAPTTASTNGAKALYVFIGTNLPTLQPMTCVGIIRVGTLGTPNYFIDITSIPSHNAQSSPYLPSPDNLPPYFVQRVNASWVGGVNRSIGSRVQARFGFLLAKKAGGTLQEVFPSRSHFFLTQYCLNSYIFAGDNVDQFATHIDLHNYSPQPRTDNDLYKTYNATTYTQPYSWERQVSSPNFCYQLGLTYFANGMDIPWITDGYTLGQLSPMKSSSQTLLPPIPRFLFVFQNSLVAAGALAENQIYQSNANSPQNWATGGSGSLLRFVTIGDAKGSGITAMGIFTPGNDAPSNPSSYMIAFKKNGTWMINTVPDPTTGVTGSIGQVGASMVQVSGRVGCVAYRSIVQTPLGTMFLGQDGNVYLINRVSEPVKVGTKIQPLLTHLCANDEWMKKCTAVYHDNHYKLSYPSQAATLLSTVANDSELWADLRTEGRDPITWVGPHNGRSIASQIIFVGDDDDLSRMAADGKTNRVFFADSTTALTDFGVEYNPRIVSKIYRFNNEMHMKRILGALADIYLDTSYANRLLLECFADEDYQQVNKTVSQGTAVWDGTQFDQTAYSQAAWLPYSLLFGADNLNGRTLQWRLTHFGPSPFAIQSLTLLLKGERRRILG